MATATASIIPSLFCGGNAKEMVEYYTSIFPNSTINKTTVYPPFDQISQHGYKAGDTLAITFTLLGGAIKMAAVNGPPNMFLFNEAISFTVTCEDQNDVDYYWDKLTDGANQSKQFCCWCQDKFGLWWQVVPKEYIHLMEGEDKAKAALTMKIGRTWKKANLEELRKAIAEMET